MKVTYPDSFEKSTNRVSGIYSITHSVTGKTYVGSSAAIFRRWRGHFVHLERGDHGNVHLQAAWAKHGGAEFTFRILERCSTDKLIEREQVHIDSVPADLRYNLSPVSGSVLGMTWECSPESRITKSRSKRLLSDEQVAEAKVRYAAGETLAQIGASMEVCLGTVHTAVRGKLASDVYAPVVGVPKRTRTPEMRARMSEAGKRRSPMSTETREKLSAAMKGRRFSDESRAKMSAAVKGRVYSPEVCAQRSAAKKAAYAANPGMREQIANARRGKTLSTEAKLKRAAIFQDHELRARLSAAHKGKPWTEAQRAARSKKQFACPSGPGPASSSDRPRFLP